MTDEEPKALARIDVARAGGRPTAASTSARTDSPILSVSRITLPTFELVYRDHHGARQQGEVLRKDRAIRIDRLIDERDGSEVVLELTVADLPFSVTLLFRIVGSGPEHTLLEWWARRQTDPQLLDLWLSALASLDAPTAETGPAPASATTDQIHEAMKLYRRVLASNPFDILGIHWTSDATVVETARASLLAGLKDRMDVCGQDPQVTQYLSPACDRVEMAADLLATMDGRQRVRVQSISDRERSNALQQARFLLEAAERSNNPAQHHRASAMLRELTYGADEGCR